jgi:hypothetical protein
MSDSTLAPVVLTDTARIVAKLAADPLKVDVANLMWLFRVSNASPAERDALLASREQFDALIDSIDDDRLKSIVKEARAVREDRLAKYIAPIDWVNRIGEDGVMRRLQKRRDAADVTKVSIPDPTVLFELESTFEAYRPDVHSLQLIARDLSPDEAAKLVTVAPAADVEERTFTTTVKELARALAGAPGDTSVTITVAAHRRPEVITPGSSVAIMGIAKKHTGTAVETAIKAAMPRARGRDKLTIKPHAVSAPMKTVEASA